jgi:hypothetical protein
MKEEIFEARKAGKTILYEKAGKIYLKGSDSRTLTEA